MRETFTDMHRPYDASTSESIRQRYLKVDTATVADVLDTLGYHHQGIAPNFAPYPPDAGKLAGWAYTLCGKMRPYAGSGDPEKMKAVDGLKPGCVSVWTARHRQSRRLRAGRRGRGNCGPVR